MLNTTAIRENRGLSWGVMSSLLIVAIGVKGQCGGWRHCLPTIAHLVDRVGDADRRMSEHALSGILPNLLLVSVTSSSTVLGSSSSPIDIKVQALNIKLSKLLDLPEG
jgi:hypothetical protein